MTLSAIIRYNKRELGQYLANQLLVRHLDPTSVMVDFSRPATTPRGPGGAFSMKMAAPPSLSSYTRKVGSVSVDDLPNFKLPRTVYMTLPGNLLFVMSTLPTTSSVTETTELPTGEIASDRITVLKVLHFHFELFASILK